MGTPSLQPVSQKYGWPSTYDWRLKRGQSCVSEPLNLWGLCANCSSSSHLNLIELNCDTPS